MKRGKDGNVGGEGKGEEGEEGNLSHSASNETLKRRAHSLFFNLFSFLSKQIRECSLFIVPYSKRKYETNLSHLITFF